MTDKLRDAAHQAEREAFERALAAKPDARFWNAADAMFWAWQARAALAQKDAQAVPQGDKGTPGAWFVRKLVRDGELKDCFVAAPSFDGMPYDAEILGDDEYRDGVERKLADCELIVAAVNALRAAPTPPAQRVMLTDEEIEQASVKGDGTHSGFARAVIEAYERKNGIK